MFVCEEIPSKTEQYEFRPFPVLRLGAEFEATQDRKALLVRVVSAGAFADW